VERRGDRAARSSFGPRGFDVSIRRARDLIAGVSSDAKLPVEHDPSRVRAAEPGEVMRLISKTREAHARADPAGVPGPASGPVSPRANAGNWVARQKTRGAFAPDQIVIDIGPGTTRRTRTAGAPLPLQHGGGPSTPMGYSWEAAGGSAGGSRETANGLPRSACARRSGWNRVAERPPARVLAIAVGKAPAHTGELQFGAGRAHRALDLHEVRPPTTLFPGLSRCSTRSSVGSAPESFLSGRCAGARGSPAFLDEWFDGDGRADRVIEPTDGPPASFAAMDAWYEEMAGRFRRASGRATFSGTRVSSPRRISGWARSIAYNLAERQVYFSPYILGPATFLPPNPLPNFLTPPLLYLVFLTSPFPLKYPFFLLHSSLSLPP